MVDPLFLIYTSGTTGLPKPCRVSHKKVWNYMQCWYRFANLTSRDRYDCLRVRVRVVCVRLVLMCALYRIYVTLPTYHSNGGTLSLSAWMAGGAIVLRRKFSASAFWDDARKYRALSSS
jgi:acyl-CoA synthetase (AMP-forming)/AMP-acid ligase II